VRFLIDLWTVPNVSNEIERMGGWSEIETYADTSWKFDLYKLCPADAHLVPLCNVAVLLKRLRWYCQSMEDSIVSCETALEEVAKNYFLSGPDSLSMRRKYPPIDGIALLYTDGLAQARAFPRVEAVVAPNKGK
jgi:hypothetical protein